MSRERLNLPVKTSNRPTWLACSPHLFAQGLVCPKLGPSTLERSCLLRSVWAMWLCGFMCPIAQYAGFISRRCCTLKSLPETSFCSSAFSTAKLETSLCHHAAEQRSLLNRTFILHAATSELVPGQYFRSVTARLLLRRGPACSTFCSASAYGRSAHRCRSKLSTRPKEASISCWQALAIRTEASPRKAAIYLAFSALQHSYLAFRR